MNALLSVVLSKLREPSTWVGLGSLVTAIGWNIKPELWAQISGVAMGLGGLLAVILSEKSSAKP